MLNLEIIKVMLKTPPLHLVERKTEPKKRVGYTYKESRKRPPSDRNIIITFDAIAAGLDTRKKLIDDSGIDKATIDRALYYMTEKKMITRTKTGLTGRSSIYKYIVVNKLDLPSKL